MAAHVAAAVAQHCWIVCKAILARSGAMDFPDLPRIGRRQDGNRRWPERAQQEDRVDPYLVEQLSQRREEALICLFYDRNGAFCAEQNYSGTLSSVIADRSSLTLAGISARARYAVLAHNHPSGAARPSANDIEATRRIYRLFAGLGISLIDHVIVADAAMPFSFRAAGLI